MIRAELRAALNPTVSSLLSSIAIDGEEAAQIRAVTDALHQTGSPDHVTLPNLMGSWWQLATSVDRYPEAIDDYTNDLCGRDLLEQALEALPQGRIAEELRSVVQTADDEFRSCTVVDGGDAVGVFIDPAGRAGWWWRRRPSEGPLSAYLDRVVGSHRDEHGS